MTDLLFDKLAYKDKLTASGIPEAQARAHADAMHEALRESVATKSDLTQLKLDLTVRMGTMLTAAVAILIGVKFFG